MSLALLPRHYDTWRLAAPDEDERAEVDEGQLIDDAYERAKDEAMREDAGELRRELAQMREAERRRAK